MALSKKVQRAQRFHALMDDLTMYTGIFMVALSLCLVLFSSILCLIGG